MKKQLLLLAFMFLSLAVNAQDAVEIDGIYYKLDINTKTAEVTRYLHHTYSGDVVIPSKVTKDEVDYSVTSIGKEAFYLSTELVSVTIPDHVTNIDNSAFYGCWSLTSVNLPNSVTHIGEYAFAQCTSLRSITIPNRSLLMKIIWITIHEITVMPSSGNRITRLFLAVKKRLFLTA